MLLFFYFLFFFSLKVFLDEIKTVFRKTAYSAWNEFSFDEVLHSFRFSQTRAGMTLFSFLNTTAFFPAGFVNSFAAGSSVFLFFCRSFF